MRLLCLLGFHIRSRGRAHYAGNGYVSECRRCATPMRRKPNGKWVAARPAPAE